MMTGPWLFFVSGAKAGLVRAELSVPDILLFGYRLTALLRRLNGRMKFVFSLWTPSRQTKIVPLSQEHGRGRSCRSALLAKSPDSSLRSTSVTSLGRDAGTMPMTARATLRGFDVNIPLAFPASSRAGDGASRSVTKVR